MSTEINDGGPAFPQTDISRAINPEGMSLRDYFAAKAMEGQIAAFFSTLARDLAMQNAQEYQRHPKDQVAVAAYEYADAMLRARKGK